MVQRALIRAIGRLPDAIVERSARFQQMNVDIVFMRFFFKVFGFYVGGEVKGEIFHKLTPFGINLLIFESTCDARYYDAISVTFS